MCFHRSGWTAAFQSLIIHQAYEVDATRWDQSGDIEVSHCMLGCGTSCDERPHYSSPPSSPRHEPWDFDCSVEHAFQAQSKKTSQYYANEQFQTSNVLLLDLLQTERDFLESSQALIEALRSAQIENYSYMKLTGELGDRFELRIN